MVLPLDRDILAVSLSWLVLVVAKQENKLYSYISYNNNDNNNNNDTVQYSFLK